MKNSKIIVDIGLLVIIALAVSWNMLDESKVVYLHAEFPTYDSQADLVNASESYCRGDRDQQLCEKA